MKDNVIGQNVRTYRNVTIRESVIGDNVLIGDDTFITGSKIRNNAYIVQRNMIFNSEIGEFTSTGWNDVIRNARIGKYCSLAWNVTVGGAEHFKQRLTTSFFPFDKAYGVIEDTEQSEIERTYSKPLIIGNDVWIAAGVQIMRGVSIGDGAILGGGGIFTKDVPPYEIWAGVPARKIGQRFSDEIIGELMALQWWDFPLSVIQSNIALFKKNIDIEAIKEIKSAFAPYKKMYSKTDITIKQEHGK